MSVAGEGARGAVLRPTGFVLLMLGFGIRLDSGWQGLACAVLLVGSIVTAAAFVRWKAGG